MSKIENNVEYVAQQDITLMVVLLRRLELSNPELVTTVMQQIDMATSVNMGGSSLDYYDETMNEFESTVIPHMYVDLEIDIPEITELLGCHKYFVVLQLYCNYAIDHNAVIMYMDDRDNACEILDSVQYTRALKETITSREIIEELVEYMTEREDEEDWAIANASKSDQMKHLVQCVSNYIDDYDTTVTMESAEDMAIEVLIRLYK